MSALVNNSFTRLKRSPKSSNIPCMAVKNSVTSRNAEMPVASSTLRIRKVAVRFAAENMAQPLITEGWMNHLLIWLSRNRCTR